MSFLKLTDHNKRDEIVKEFLALKNKIKDNFRRERLGEIETQSDLAVFYPCYRNANIYDQGNYGRP